MVLSAPSNRDTAKLNTALPGCVAVTVYSIVPNRATRDNRIGRCVKSPLKNDAAVADEFVEFIGYINLRIEAAAGS